LAWKGYQRFYEVDIPYFVTLQTWARFLDPMEPMHAALAMVGKQASGLVHSIYHRSTWATGNYCYLQDLFVADDARGSGIGRALIEHIYANAKRRGVSRVHWSTARQSQNCRPLIITAISSRCHCEVGRERRRRSSRANRGPNFNTQRLTVS
jgi:GNAT superfamily N-acetyltransferase